MSILEAIGLGALQGVTEFLPISSSGHLVIGQHLLGIAVPGNAFEIWVHLGTLLSILVVFRKKILSLLSTVSRTDTRRYIGFLIAGTVPAVVIGLGFRETLEGWFDSIGIVSAGLAVTGLLLFLTKAISPKPAEITLKIGIIIGFAQALAIVPGISRSGATIAAALCMGVSSKDAAQFSFLLAIPAIAGAGILTALDAVQYQETALSLPMILSGLITSFGVGWISLRWLLAIIQQGKLYWFGTYCIAVGVILFFS